MITLATHFGNENSELHQRPGSGLVRTQSASDSSNRKRSPYFEVHVLQAALAVLLGLMILNLLTNNDTVIKRALALKPEIINASIALAHQNIARSDYMQRVREGRANSLQLMVPTGGLQKSESRDLGASSSLLQPEDVSGRNSRDVDTFVD